MSKKLTSVLVVSIILFSFMIQPSKAGLFEADAMYDTAKAVNALTAKIGELVEAQKEQNELLRLIKNKLSDIAVLQAVGKCYPIYTDSEENTGYRSVYPSQTSHYAKDRGGYYYFNDNLKPFQSGK